MRGKEIQFTKNGVLFTGICFVLVVLLPVCNLLPQDMFLHLSNFYLQLFGKYLSLAILALGLGLLWGYTGILSLGQAIFFGLGGYVMGMHLTLGIGAEQSKYGEALPDFMVWNQLTELPLFWEPFSSFPVTLAGIILVPAFFAVVFGYLTFHSRIRGVYFAILTQALVYACWLMFNRNEMNLGGTNGLTDFKTLAGFSLLSASTQRGLYILTAVCLIGSYLVCRWIVSSKTGKVLRAIRDNENRLRYSGYSTTGFKVFAFAVSAMLGGISGALYVPQVGIMTPGQIGVLPSLEVVVWVALGGREHLLGGPLGAIVVNALRTILTTHFPQLWPFFLGGLFVGGVLLFPAGLIGLPEQIRKLIRRYSKTSPPVSDMGPREKKKISRPDAASSPSLRSLGETALIQPPVSGTGGVGHKEETILYVEGVTVSFEGFHALENLNFIMNKGELRFVIGPNGAGKTTLLDVLCGKVKPIKGRVMFEDRDILPLREHQIANSGIGRKFQAPTIFPRHTVEENIYLSLGTDKSVVSTLLARYTRKEQERVEEVLETVGLAHRGSMVAGGLSHGQKQWLEIGMLIAQDPRLLLLDEPVAGMSGPEREQTGILLESISRKHSILVIEHDMEFVRQLARTVTVMHEGTVLCEGPMDQIQKDPRVVEVYLGREQEIHA